MQLMWLKWNQSIEDYNEIKVIWLQMDQCGVNVIEMKSKYCEFK